MKLPRFDIRSYLFVASIFAALLIVAPAQAQFRIGNNSMVNIETNGKHTYMVKKNGRSLSIEFKGDIEFNEDDTDVVYLSRGSFLEIEDKRRGERHNLRIEGSTNGEPTYRYKYNGRNRDFAEIDRDWYETMLITLIRESGAGAEQRTARILKSDGVDGVLREVNLIDSNSARIRYMSHLFDQAKLNDEQMRRVAGLAEKIGSSGDKSRFLQKHADKFLASNEVAPDYFDAIESIPSSGDKTRVLMSLVEDDLLDDRESYLEAIRIAKSIPSSGDRSRFLIKASNLYIAEASDLYFDAVASIPSSGDKTRVMLSLIENNALNDGMSFRDAMRIAKGIPSSGDRARFLIAAADAYDTDGREAFFDAVSTIPSSGDHARVLIYMAKQVDMDNASIAGYLGSARNISSSGDKARVLVAVADEVAGNDDLVEVYIKTAETISSSGDYRRALSALLN